MSVLRLPLGILLLLLTAAPAVAAALSADGLALLAFKAAVTDDPSSALSSWSDADADPCGWLGVTCDGRRRVVAVAVAGKNLSGHIPSELGSLALLRRLNLHGNRLSGAVPAALANATALRSLFLYDNRLTGPLPAAALCGGGTVPTKLQNLDLSRNALSGALPPEIGRCRQLQRLLLAGNEFSGDLPAAAGIWKEMAAGLQMLDLSCNNLTGAIPAGLGELSALAGTLNLSHNHLSGGVPVELGRLPATVTLDLRFNNLSGEIPQSGSLATQGPTAFLNNPGLCGFPLQVPCRAAAAAPPSPSSSPPPPPATNGGAAGGVPRPIIKTSLIVLVSVADAVAVASLGVIAVYVYWKVYDRRRRQGQAAAAAKDDDEYDEEGRARLFPCPCCTRAADACSDDDNDDGKCSSSSNGGGGELVAIDRRGFRMELDELLRSSAYVLGKGGKGIVYKVVVGNGTTPVAVRRLGGGAAAPERCREFAAEACAIGRVRHPNVVRLRAYYWSADEKLVVTDFVNNGNLATALRGRSGQPSLSWTLRLRIAKGAARGLAHIHECSPRRFVHGDVKPSNILLDADYNALVADFGLARLLAVAGCTDDDAYSVAGTGGIMAGALPYARPAAALTEKRSAAYRAPEARAAAPAGSSSQPPPPPPPPQSQKSDVYSFGVLLLELLTGKPPAEHASPPSASSSGQEQQAPVELVRWVRQGFEDARPLSELADAALLRDDAARKQVVAAFHIALACVEEDPERRPRMKAVSDSLDKIGA